MTTATTPRDFRSPINGAAPDLDSPGMSTPARARIPSTQSDRNGKSPAPRRGSWLSRQDFWTIRPASLETAWNSSRVDTRRIPNDSDVLRRLWKLSNATDRLLMFALIQLAPGFLQGPLRHFVQRPTRRWSLYLVLTALAVTLIIGG